MKITIKISHKLHIKQARKETWSDWVDCSCWYRDKQSLLFTASYITYRQTTTITIM